MIDTDCIHPPRGVERRAKLGAGHSESINADYINIIIINADYINIKSNNTDYINIIYNIYLYRYYC